MANYSFLFVNKDKIIETKHWVNTNLTYKNGSMKEKGVMRKRQ